MLFSEVYFTRIYYTGLVLLIILYYLTTNYNYWLHKFTLTDLVLILTKIMLVTRPRASFLG